MPNDIKVSVICNVYNHEKYVRDALEGFVKQNTNFAFEVLVHDDASTDKSADIIREYEKKYPDIIKPVYQTENQYSKHDGTIKRIQVGRTQGKYVAFCEGDDYWTDSNKLQKQYGFMETHPEYSLCVHSSQRLNMLNGNMENYFFTKDDRDVSIEDIIIEKHGRIFQFSSIFTRTYIWKKMATVNLGMPIGDYPLAVFCAYNGKVRMLADCMSVYRWNVLGSWTHCNNNNAYRIDTCMKKINGYKKMDEYTRYNYHQIFMNKIKRCEYYIAILTGDWNTIKADKDLMAIYYNDRDFVHQVSDRVRCLCPKLHKKIMRLCHRIR